MPMLGGMQITLLTQLQSKEKSWNTFQYCPLKMYNISTLSGRTGFCRNTKSGILLSSWTLNYDIFSDQVSETLEL